ncbi:MAG: phage holin family protein [Candidatus Jacksonbacteria bacterium]|jgi:putative membrane protein|nr:phage holin family protein [Candidatus Jacksonbacteria bacterium]MBT6034256.1 phage holin family protein [Candidatus Jacksonbacteria bacterium]MBT6301334.1 phage holin family protein [Candidatus Jacksonbacteria bacterium]MBT6756976.1 phage holin family protein [Candidatus Jacksonbacteria bacterium]MBT6955249.1 phage holin family protein [Candidatus Jacksonbacteria bacterium]
MNRVLKLLLSAAVILIAAYLLPGVVVTGLVAALVTAIVIGLINAFLRPIILLLTLPINILSLGLLTFVINALLVLLASAVVPGFTVAGFWWALLFSLVVSILNAFINSFNEKPVVISPAQAQKK